MIGDLDVRSQVLVMVLYLQYSVLHFSDFIPPISPSVFSRLSALHEVIGEHFCLTLWNRKRSDKR